jgi:hypothetical protein
MKTKDYREIEVHFLVLLESPLKWVRFNGGDFVISRPKCVLSNLCHFTSSIKIQQNHLGSKNCRVCTWGNATLMFLILHSQMMLLASFVAQLLL